MKQAIHGLVGLAGYELCKLNDSERELQRSWQTDGANLNYKDTQLIKGISAPGHISVEEARFLGELVRSTAPSEAIIEIGTLFGFSTMVMTLAKAPHQPLITVDNYSWNPLGMTSAAHRIATSSILKEAETKWNVRVVAADKEEFFRSFDPSVQVGLFFCDADHRYEATKSDLLWAKKIGAKVICGHDYDHERHAGVARAVDELGGPSKLAGSLFVL